MAEIAAPTAPASPMVSLVKDAEKEVRMGFVRKVYGILSAQLLITVLIAAPFQVMSQRTLAQNSWMLSLSTILMLCTICSMMCLNAKFFQKPPQNYIFLFFLSACMGVSVGFTS